MQADLFKTKFNLMSLSFHSNDHRRISIPHPLPFEGVFFEGMFIRDTVMVELGMEISNNDSWLMNIKKRKLLAKFYRI